MKICNGTLSIYSQNLSPTVIRFSLYKMIKPSFFKPPNIVKGAFSFTLVTLYVCTLLHPEFGFLSLTLVGLHQIIWIFYKMLNTTKHRPSLNLSGFVNVTFIKSAHLQIDKCWILCFWCLNHTLWML